MAGLSGTLTDTVVSLLTSTSGGVNVRVGAIEQGDDSIQAPGIRTIVALNVSVDISEKTGHAQYPALLVYCDKVSNTLKEKFRTFSGKAHVVVEVRHSQDTLDRIESSVAGLRGCGMRAARRLAGGLGLRAVLRGRIRRELRTRECAAARIFCNEQKWDSTWRSASKRWHTFHRSQTAGMWPRKAHTARYRQSRRGTGFPQSNLPRSSSGRRASARTRRAAEHGQGMPAGMRKQTTFDMTSYMTGLAGYDDSAVAWTAVAGGDGRPGRAVAGERGQCRHYRVEHRVRFAA